MYGMVNRAIKEYVENHCDGIAWNDVKVQANLQVEEFQSMEQYEDAVSVDLIVALSEIQGISPAKVLEHIGEFWIDFAYRSEYGSLIDMAGTTLPEILMQLDELHERVGESFEHLKPPSFWCTNVSDNSLTLHYVSEREGLAPMVIGLIKGLGKHLSLTCEVTHTAQRSEGANHDEFAVTYTNRVDVGEPQDEPLEASA